MPNLNFWGKLNTLREQIKFDQERKLKIRNFLINEINNSKLINESYDANQKKYFWSGLVISRYQFKYVAAFATILILIISGSGLSLAAESSLPGELLYPIKINVNEQVLGSLTFGDKAKIELEARLAARRLEEAELLMLSGKLDNDTQSNIESNFEKHSQNVSNGVSNLESSRNSTDAAEITSKFESSLRAHEQIIRKLGDNSSEEVKSRIRPVEAKVKERLQKTSSKRFEFDNSIAGRASSSSGEANNILKNSAQGKIDTATVLIDALEKSILNQKDLIAPEVFNLAENRIKSARSLIELAKSKIETSNYGEAFNLAQNAIRKINVANLLKKASTELKLDGGLKDESDDNESDGIENKVDGNDDKASVQSGFSTSSDFNTKTKKGGDERRDSEREEND